MNKTKKLVFAAVLTAMSIILLYIPFLRFPIFAAAPFLEYDAMDVPIMIATLFMGLKGGLAVTLVSCVIQGITVSSSSGIYGIIMHFIATGGFVAGTALMMKLRLPPGGVFHAADGDHTLQPREGVHQRRRHVPGVAASQESQPELTHRFPDQRRSNSAPWELLLSSVYFFPLCLAE